MDLNGSVLLVAGASMTMVRRFMVVIVVWMAVTMNIMTATATEDRTTTMTSEQQTNRGHKAPLDNNHKIITKSTRNQEWRQKRQQRLLQYNQQYNGGVGASAAAGRPAPYSANDEAEWYHYDEWQGKTTTTKGTAKGGGSGNGSQYKYKGGSSGGSKNGGGKGGSSSNKSGGGGGWYPWKPNPPPSNKWGNTVQVVSFSNGACLSTLTGAPDYTTEDCTIGGALDENFIMIEPYYVPGIAPVLGSFRLKQAASAGGGSSSWGSNSGVCLLAPSGCTDGDSIEFGSCDSVLANFIKSDQGSTFTAIGCGSTIFPQPAIAVDDTDAVVINNPAQADDTESFYFQSVVSNNQWGGGGGW